MSDQSTTKSQSYLCSIEHLTGCISTMIGYGLVLTGVIEWSWYNTLFIFYSIGWFFGIKVFSSSEEIKYFGEQQNQITIIPETSPPPPPPQTDLHKPTLAKENQIIDDFLKLKLAHELDLPYPSVKILNEIHQVLVMLHQQTEKRSDVFTVEINNTQKIVYQYLQPTIENYLKVPRYYAGNRVIQDGKTAKDLLIEQLELLKEELFTLLDNILADNLIGLTIHAEFLKQKLKPYQFFKTNLES